MSSNLKGGNPAVRFLLNHGEKLWMLGIVVCASMLIWSAIGRERLDDNKAPEDLQNLISRANTHIQKFNWAEAPDDVKLTASTVNSEAMKPIPHKHFPPLNIKFDTRVLDPVKLRTDPELLAAQDIEVYGDSGIFSTSTPESIAAKKLKQRAEADQKEQDQRRKKKALFDDPKELAKKSGRTRTGAGGVIIESPPGFRAQSGGLEDTKAASWVTVVAKIPIKDQYLRYQNALASARNYSKKLDLPEYKGYLVFRTEVTSAGDGPWKMIESVYNAIILKQQLQNSIQVPPLVGGNYYHSLLTYPLPTLLLREWGKHATHSDIPLIGEELSRTEAAVEPGEEESTEGAAADDDGLFGDSSRSRRTDRGKPGNVAAQPLAQARKPRGGSGAKGGQSTSSAYVWDEQTEFLLFRYIDRRVQPGKQYRYKIQLVLFDVNDGADEAYLEKTVLKRRAPLKGKKLEYRFAPESEPSPIVSVPLMARAYLVEAKPAREDNVNAEPELELLLKTYDGKMVAEAARLDSVKRGRVINIHEQAAVLWTNAKTDKPKTDFDFYTGITMLDVVGGETLHRKYRDFTAPSRAVMMDASGRLFIQSQIEDYDPVSAYQTLVDSKKKPRSSSKAVESKPRSKPAGGRPRKRN